MPEQADLDQDFAHPLQAHFVGDGQTNLLWSPWKKRERPVRQVLHALFTFTSGVHVWRRATERSLFSDEASLERCEAYIATHTAFAIEIAPRLLSGDYLTPSGEAIVRGVVDRLSQSNEPRRETAPNVESS